MEYEGSYALDWEAMMYLQNFVYTASILAEFTFCKPLPGFIHSIQSPYHLVRTKCTGSALKPGP